MSIDWSRTCNLSGLKANWAITYIDGSQKYLHSARMVGQELDVPGATVWALKKQNLGTRRSTQIQDAFEAHGIADISYRRHQ